MLQSRKNWNVWFLICLLPLAVMASLNFTLPSGQVYKVRSGDFFQTRPAHFKLSGHPVEVKLRMNAKTGKCELLTDGLSKYVPKNSPKVEQHLHSIMFLAYQEACSFYCLTETFPFVEAFQKRLKTLGYPSPDTLVLIREIPDFIPIDPGSPLMDYTSRSFFVSDGPPEPSFVKFLQVDLVGFKELVGMLRNNTEMLVEVTQEPGIWNDTFFSAAYLSGLGIFMVATFFILIVACYQIFVNICDKVVVLDLRNTIFFMGFFSALLVLTISGLRIFSLAARVIDTVQSFLSEVAFHLLLYFWSVFLMTLTRSKKVYFFRVIVVISMTATVVGKVYNMTYLFVESTQAVQNAANILFGFIIAPVQGVLAVVFLIFAFLFYYKKKTLGIQSESTLKSLDRLTWLAVAGFLCYLILALLNSPLYRNQNNLAVWYAVNQTVYTFAVAIRFVALMCILGVRSKSKIQRDKTWLESQVSRFQDTLAKVGLILVKPKAGSTTASGVSTEGGSITKLI